MAEKKLVPAEKFREVALNNDYEVFDEADVAAYAKDTMMKSQAGEISQADREEFAVEMAGLQKAICANEDGSQCTLYYRKPLVDWKVDDNGVIMKGIAGTYTDTPENRRLHRVGQVYVPSPDVIKSIYGSKDDIEESTVDAEMVEQANSIKKSCAVVTADADRRLALGEIDEELCKSVKTEVGMYLTSWGDTLDECCDVVKCEDLADVREDLADATAAFADIVKAAHGRYADTAKNRRLHRVGQEYGKAAQEKDKGEKKQGVPDGESDGEKPSRNGDSVKRDLSILEENKDKIVEKYGQEAYDRKVEALKKEGEDFEQKETVKQLKERADKQDAEEEERRKAEKRAKRQEKRRARHAAKREAAKKVKEEEEAKAKAEKEKETKAKEETEDWVERTGGDGSKDLKSFSAEDIRNFFASRMQEMITPEQPMSGYTPERLSSLLDSMQSVYAKALKEGKVDDLKSVLKWNGGGSGLDYDLEQSLIKYVDLAENGASPAEAKKFAEDSYKIVQDVEDEKFNGHSGTGSKAESESALGVAMKRMDDAYKNATSVADLKKIKQAADEAHSAMKQYDDNKKSFLDTIKPIFGEKSTKIVSNLGLDIEKFTKNSDGSFVVDLPNKRQMKLSSKGRWNVVGKP